jgi:hypothetical protein
VGADKWEEEPCANAEEIESSPATAIGRCRIDEKKHVERVTPRSYISGSQDGNLTPASESIWHRLKKVL